MKKFRKKKKISNNMGVNMVINLSEDEKQKLVEYRKNYYKIRKKRVVII